MKTLFIDTHGEKLRITFVDDNNIIDCEKDSSKGHSEIAVDTLKGVLASAKCEVKNLDQIIVVNGPGSFTGVRIGVTIAKTLAYTFNIPIKTITSLEMYGVSENNDFDLIAIKDSKGYYSARYVDNKYSDFSYRKTSEFESYVKNYNLRFTIGSKFDVEKVLKYVEGQENLNPHMVNPIYIKELNL